MVIKGIITHIKFHSDETGFTVAVVEAEEDTFTAVGVVEHLHVQEEVTLKGEWTYHDSFGEQFNFKEIERTLPSTTKGIKAYLASGLIPGVGEVMADRIVEAFGEETLDILEKSPERLLEIEGIGDKKYKRIEEALMEHHSMKRVLVQLQSLEIPSSMAVKLYRYYGDDALAVIQNNPYQIAEDVSGIGFVRADQIAQLVGIPKDSPYRIQAGMYYALVESTNNGHCCLPEELWKDAGMKILQEDRELIEEQMLELRFDPRLAFVNHEGETYIFPQTLHLAETSVARRLMDMTKMTLDKPWLSMEQAIETIQEEDGIVFAEKQREGIVQSFSHGVHVITGGPGTGKTTTLRAILKIADKLGLSVSLAAPTGRAAKRMTEATGAPASTVHRLLEYTYSPEGMFFQRDGDNPLEADMFIIDETSMMDIVLMQHLLEAIPITSRLILLGDENQLPSVGPGNVLADILESDEIPSTFLTEIFRQAQESMIITNAHRINDGEMPDARGDHEDFFFIRRKNHHQILEEVVELLDHRLPDYYDLNAVDDIQVLSPMRKGEAGVENLNIQLQQVLNPPEEKKPEVKKFGTTFRLGDKVMQLKNNYQITWTNPEAVFSDEAEGEGIYNGDIGRITDVDHYMEELTVRMDDGRIVVYEFGALEDLTLAYATTIHKAQGSEFPAVVIPVYYGSPQLMNRNLLYTGVTRAKSLVVLVGQSGALAKMVNNAHVQPRYTMLKEKMVQWKGMGEVHDFLS